MSVSGHCDECVAFREKSPKMAGKTTHSPQGLERDIAPGSESDVDLGFNVNM